MHHLLRCPLRKREIALLGPPPLAFDPVALIEASRSKQWRRTCSKRSILTNNPVRPLPFAGKIDARESVFTINSYLVFPHVRITGRVNNIRFDMQSCLIELCVVPLLLISCAFCLPNDTTTTTVEYVSENSTTTATPTGTEEIECK